MLVLAVNLGDYVEIKTETGETVKVFVHSTSKFQARLGFEAKKSITIMRSTLLEKERNKENATDQTKPEGQTEGQEEPNAT